MISDHTSFSGGGHGGHWAGKINFMGEVRGVSGRWVGVSFNERRGNTDGLRME